MFEFETYIKRFFKKDLLNSPWNNLINSKIPFWF